MTYYTTKTAAQTLGLTMGRIRQLLLSGRMKGKRHGRDWIIPATAVEQARERPKPGPRPKKQK